MGEQTALKVCPATGPRAGQHGGGSGLDGSMATFSLCLDGMEASAMASPRVSEHHG